MRRLVYAALPDALAILVIAAIPWGERIPVAFPLVGAAALARWLHGAPADAGRWRPAVAVGAACGALALVLSLAVATPLLDAVVPINWSTYAVARGNPAAGALVAIVAVCVAFGSELALRGWIVERARTLGAPPAIAIACGALAEALVTPGPLAGRLGAALFGGGLGVIYYGARRDLAAPIAARAVFALGVVVLETLQLVG